MLHRIDRGKFQTSLLSISRNRDDTFFLAFSIEISLPHILKINLGCYAWLLELT